LSEVTNRSDGALVPVHGGLSKLVENTIPLSQRKAFLAEAEGLPSVVVTKADLSAVYRLGDGALSPLEGLMQSEEWHQVLEEMVILREGTKYVWGIPISFPLTDEEAATLSPGCKLVLRNEEGEIVATVSDVEVFEYDKKKYNQCVYVTDRFDHPGGHMVKDDPRTKLLGGRIQTLPQPLNLHYGQFMLSPRMTRALIRDRKWERVVAFQTRNPLHRAHEYALVAGVEQLTRAGHYSGVILNPLMGELKGDDVPAGTRMDTYQRLHDERLLGKGDKDEALWAEKGYDLTDVFELIGLDIKMYYGGPREAIMHSIYRQNYGFSDIIIGRKHADAPYDDGAAIWGDFDAHEIFDKLPGELHIQPCKVGFAAFYESLGRVDLMEKHPDEKPVFISGSKVREQLLSGETPDSRIMRPETAEVLIKAYRG